MPTVDVLPDDVLAHILTLQGLEPHPKYLVIASQVCRRFASIVNSHCWKMLCLRVAPTMVVDLFASEDFSNYHGEREVDPDQLREPPEGWLELARALLCCPMGELKPPPPGRALLRRPVVGHVQVGPGEGIPNVGASWGPRDKVEFVSESRLLNEKCEGDILYLRRPFCSHLNGGLFPGTMIVARGLIKDFPKSKAAAVMAEFDVDRLEPPCKTGCNYCRSDLKRSLKKADCLQKDAAKIFADIESEWCQRNVMMADLEACVCENGHVVLFLMLLERRLVDIIQAPVHDGGLLYVPNDEDSESDSEDENE